MLIFKVYLKIENNFRIVCLCTKFKIIFVKNGHIVYKATYTTSRILECDFEWNFGERKCEQRFSPPMTAGFECTLVYFA